MTTTKQPTKNKAGRPAKIKLKHNPKTSADDYYKKYGELGVCAIYGVDEFTEHLIDYLWKHPDMSIICTDPNESRLSNINRKIGQRSFSMYRWNVYPESGFIEQPVVDIILVSRDCWEEVNKRPNPYGVELLLLEEI